MIIMIMIILLLLLLLIVIIIIVKIIMIYACQAAVRGNHLSDNTCLTQAFFHRGE